MSYESIYIAFGIVSTLVATLVAYGFMPFNVAPEKAEEAEKLKKIVRIIGPLGFVALIVVAVAK